MNKKTYERTAPSHSYANKSFKQKFQFHFTSWLMDMFCGNDVFFYFRLFLFRCIADLCLVHMHNQFFFSKYVRSYLFGCCWISFSSVSCCFWNAQGNQWKDNIFFSFSTHMFVVLFQTESVTKWERFFLWRCHKNRGWTNVSTMVDEWMRWFFCIARCKRKQTAVMHGEHCTEIKHTQHRTERVYALSKWVQWSALIKPRWSTENYTWMGSGILNRKCCVWLYRHCKRTIICFCYTLTRSTQDRIVS